MKTMSLETLELTARTLGSVEIGIATTEGNLINGYYRQQGLNKNYKWVWKINGIPSEKSSLVFNLNRGLGEITFYDFA